MCALFGLYAGAMYGGAFGTAGMVLASVISVMLAPDISLSVISIAAICGFLAGAIAGAMSGPPLSLLLRETSGSFDRRALMVVLAMIFALTIAGCAAAIAPSLVGITLSLVCGLIGGSLLARRLSRFVGAR
jgi:hypothetical protein